MFVTVIMNPLPPFDSRSVDLFNTLNWIDSSVHMRNTRYCNLNLLSPRYNYAKEGGGSFTFRYIKDCNSILRPRRVLDGYSRFKYIVVQGFLLLWYFNALFRSLVRPSSFLIDPKSMEKVTTEQ